MKIETAGLASKKSGSKFAVIVRAGDDKREYVHDVSGDHTLNQIELLAVQFAILGAKPTISMGTIGISTPSAYVADMLERDEDENWIKTPKSNVELVEEIRSLLSESDIRIVYEKNEEARTLCRSK